MNAQDICDALRRYLSESEDDQREIATKIGISWNTLSAWLAGEAEPPKSMLARWRVFLDVPDTEEAALFRLLSQHRQPRERECRSFLLPAHRGLGPDGG
jgi:transcriptional regulator with XRE-family HTH domain